MAAAAEAVKIALRLQHDVFSFVFVKKKISNVSE
jgi:hypothetical protein